ncbi:MAG TPA: hypothetical protein VFI93_05365 [Rhizomicrobium sp.]|nr:hypothetical protein [Rhizomicrobium sp.]
MVGSAYRVGFAALLGVCVSLGASAPAFAKSSNVWRITKTHWSSADEKGFGDFVQAIGESICSSSESCLRNPANPYRHLDPRGFDIDADCAKWPYMLRAYYAWHNGLPFSIVNAVSGKGGDIRYSKTANRAVSRHDFIDHGKGINGPRAVRETINSVYSATYRTDARESKGVLSDFYSPALQPGSIRPGTIVYDINGHVGIIYKVDADGRAYYMDAHPDFSVSRSVYGAQFGQSPARLGGGFKNWRPFVLKGARRNAAGDYIGGKMVFAENDAIPDFSLVQYTGTEPNPKDDVKKAVFDYNGVPLGFYEYVRVAVSGGKMTFNPIYELHMTMKTLCNDLKDRAQYVDQAIAERLQNKAHPPRLPDNIYGSSNVEWETYSTPSRDARIKAAFQQFYRDMKDMIGMWVNRDKRVVYDGQFLKRDLAEAYAQESKACTITYLSSDKRPVPITFDDMAHRLYRLSFDPYDCIERRWGASGKEADSCPDGRSKTRWYEAEQRLRNQSDRTYDVSMNFSVSDLEDHKPGTGIDDPPPVDVKSLIDGIGPQVSFEGMTPVGH